MNTQLLVNWLNIDAEAKDEDFGLVLVAGENIPHICHFFTRAKFLENRLYTEKHQFFALNL